MISIKYILLLVLLGFMASADARKHNHRRAGDMDRAFVLHAQCRGCVASSVNGQIWKWCGSPGATSDKQGYCTIASSSCASEAPVEVLNVQSCPSDKPASKDSCSSCLYDGYVWCQDPSRPWDEQAGACIAETEVEQNEDGISAMKHEMLDRHGRKARWGRHPHPLPHPHTHRFGTCYFRKPLSQHAIRDVDDANHLRRLDHDGDNHDEDRKPDQKDWVRGWALRKPKHCPAIVNAIKKHDWHHGPDMDDMDDFGGFVIFLFFVAVLAMVIASVKRCKRNARNRREVQAQQQQPSQAVQAQYPGSSFMAAPAQGPSAPPMPMNSYAQPSLPPIPVAQPVRAFSSQQQQQPNLYPAQHFAYTQAMVQRPQTAFVPHNANAHAHANPQPMVNVHEPNSPSFAPAQAYPYMAVSPSQRAPLLPNSEAPQRPALFGRHAGYQPVVNQED